MNAVDMGIVVEVPARVLIPGMVIRMFDPTGLSMHWAEIVRSVEAECEFLAFRGRGGSHRAYGPADRAQVLRGHVSVAVSRGLLVWKHFVEMRLPSGELSWEPVCDVRENGDTATVFGTRGVSIEVDTFAAVEVVCK